MAHPFSFARALTTGLVLLAGALSLAACERRNPPMPQVTPSVTGDSSGTGMGGTGNSGTGGGASFGSPLPQASSPTQ